MRNRAKQYYLLAKPGIIRGNLLTAAAGYFLGTNGSIDWLVFLGLIAGTALVIGGGCVINNYIDRSIDSKMDRTRKRATVTGAISARSVIIYGTILSVSGFIVLALLTNWLATYVGFVGFIFYVVVYSIFKRKSPVGTLVGSVSGATPPVAGYVAATGSVDAVSALLFIILACWQMAHFYAIAIYRKKEYQKAGIPLLSIEKGVDITRQRIVGYMIAFTVAIVGLFAVSDLGWVYLFVMIGVCIYWLSIGLQSFNKGAASRWAQRVFGSSLIVLLLFSVSISVGHLLP